MSRRVFKLERHRRQRRQADHERMRPALPREILRFEAAHVADIAAAVGLGISVDDLAIKTGSGHPESVAMTDDRGRVHGKDDRAALARAPPESDDAVLGSVEIDPLEN